jgi:hypothetical protein
MTGADLEAFLRRAGDVPRASGSALIRSLSRIRGSEDPVVTFADLASACVPDFADGCRAELSDGIEPDFRTPQPASPHDDRRAGAVRFPGSAQLLLTPFRADSVAGYPSYAGLVTHCWNNRAPSLTDAAIAELMVKHAIALVDRERLTAAVARAEDRAANLALRAITGSTVTLATGIIMHQNRLPADQAESHLRQVARAAGKQTAQMAAEIVHHGGLAGPPPPSPGQVVHLRQHGSCGSRSAARPAADSGFVADRDMKIIAIEEHRNCPYP